MAVISTETIGNDLYFPIVHLTANTRFVAHVEAPNKCSIKAGMSTGEGLHCRQIPQKKTATTLMHKNYLLAGSSTTCTKATLSLSCTSIQIGGASWRVDTDNVVSIWKRNGQNKGTCARWYIQYMINAVDWWIQFTDLTWQGSITSGYKGAF